jgi:hypothetical protein
MVDPRLNSVHLEFPRREQYRQAREAVLNARGQHTLAGEQLEGDDEPGRPRTAIARGVRPVGVRCWLTDGDYVYPLHLGLNTVGRSPDNDVVVHDGYVSRRHCAIVVHAGRPPEVFDTASKNGTFVNGQKLAAPHRLRPGDEIRMCDRNLVFVWGGPEPGPADTHTLAD